MRRATEQRLGRIVVAALAWTALGVLFALPGLTQAGDVRRALLGPLTQWWCWGVAATAIVWIDARLPVSERPLLRRFFVHLLPSFALTSIYVYVLAGVRAAFGLGAWSALFSTSLFTGALRGMFLWNWLIYWLILGAWQAHRYYERYLSSELRLERMERNFSEARLNALRMQLDPHFLFNALNTISSQVERDPRLARAMIEHLGDLLRLSLESRDRQEVPLAEELAFLDHYLAIQKIRFGDQLKIAVDIAPDVRFALVPSLIVQPLVENAIRHGISRRATGGTVAVTAVAAGARLLLRVLDDGVGLGPGWTLDNSTGLGLSVTRQRIAALHANGDSGFAVRRRDGGGTEVEIVLPLRLNGEEEHGQRNA